LCPSVTPSTKVIQANHSDLKLENILLDKSENIKLADFGFTREYDTRKLLETWCGTYSYAAPEMIQGQKYSGEGTRPGMFHADGQRLTFGAWVSFYMPFCAENSHSTRMMK